MRRARVRALPGRALAALSAVPRRPATAHACGGHGAHLPRAARAPSGLKDLARDWFPRGSRGRAAGHRKRRITITCSSSWLPVTRHTRGRGRFHNSQHCTPVADKTSTTMTLTVPPEILACPTGRHRQPCAVGARSATLLRAALATSAAGLPLPFTPAAFAGAPRPSPPGGLRRRRGRSRPWRGPGRSR